MACVGVHSLAPSYAPGLIDQASLVGVAAGLESGEPGCKHNILRTGSAQARRQQEISGVP